MVPPPCVGLPWRRSTTDNQLGRSADRWSQLADGARLTADRDSPRLSWAWKTAFGHDRMATGNTTVETAGGTFSEKRGQRAAKSVTRLPMRRTRRSISGRDRWIARPEDNAVLVD